jgi:Zn-dependent protease with chaperone function
MNLWAYWFSDTMVLRLYDAREVDARSAPQFHAIVSELAARARLPMPRVYVIDEAQPNAFATGRDPEHAAVAAPIAARLIQFAISRSREYEADRGGAGLAGDPRALADALAKIERHARGIALEAADAHPATAQMMIVNPLLGGGLASWFGTHPPLDERVGRLFAMAR